MSSADLPTVWMLGDQLDRTGGALGERRPGECRVLLVESASLATSRGWHRQRLHLVQSAMAHFAAELREEGFEVDHRRSASLREGYAEHVAEFAPAAVVATEAASWDGRTLQQQLGVETERSTHFLCHADEFAEWADGRNRLRMEDFYRWQRTRLDILLDGDEPEGGRWNHDHDNRLPPPRDGRDWPPITRFDLDDIDREVIAALPSSTVGDEPDGTWPVTRTQALQRLAEFVEHALDPFGPYEDAMLDGEWKLAHSALSSSLNLGLLRPDEVVAAAIEAYAEGAAPLNSVEGFVRQVIGWREFVWGIYWLHMPDYRDLNRLEADDPLPPAFAGSAGTEMRCLSDVLARVDRHAYVHHIERLMVLGNLALTAGIRPRELTAWMWERFIDGAEWVMVPNVFGMALYADGGVMATKPYASGGAYINKMSDHCRDCRFDPRQRTGPDACPYTTLYWDFLARNEERLGDNHRLSRQLASMRKLRDLPAVRERAVEVRRRLGDGTL